MLRLVAFVFCSLVALSTFARPGGMDSGGFMPDCENVRERREYCPFMLRNIGVEAVDLPEIYLQFVDGCERYLEQTGSEDVGTCRPILEQLIGSANKTLDI